MPHPSAAAILIVLLSTVPVFGAELPILVSEFIYEEAPFPQCHASTLAETPWGLVASWFGGEHEKHPSVGIWVSRHDGQSWTVPVEVANGNQTEGPVERFPCWNPVLHQVTDGPLLLFYKVGPSPRDWWGMVIRSEDGGKSWSEPERLPEGILGPIKNKPIELPGGVLLSGSSTEHDGWRVHFEWSADGGKSWQKTDSINTGEQFGIIQPTVMVAEDGRLVAYCRSRQQTVVQTISQDGGRSWSAPELTDLPNNNSGLDAVTMADGRHALIYNHTTRGRTPLNLAIAPANLSGWEMVATLETEPGEYSYPAIIQTKDGKLHMTYTWKREKVKHVVVDPTAR